MTGVRTQFFFSHSKLLSITPAAHLCSWSDSKKTDICNNYKGSEVVASYDHSRPERTRRRRRMGLFSLRASMYVNSKYWLKFVSKYKVCKFSAYYKREIFSRVFISPKLCASITVNSCKSHERREKSVENTMNGTCDQRRCVNDKEN